MSRLLSDMFRCEYDEMQGQQRRYAQIKWNITGRLEKRREGGEWERA